MTAFILSQNAGKFLAPLAKLIGWVMNGIYVLMHNLFGIENVALTIIILTLIIYLCLLPLTIQQQKFSKMTQIMNPEIQAVQKKYKGRKDQESMTRMNEETQAVYKKYGVSPSGSCVQLVIQLPILFALYRVIANVPGYINSIKSTFDGVVAGIMATPGYQDTMSSFYDSVRTGNYVMKNISPDFASSNVTTLSNSIIDVLYKCTSANWATLKETFSSLTDVISTTQVNVDHVNSLFNIGNFSIVYAPKNIIGTAFHAGQYGLIILAILIPVLSAATQFLNIRLMPQAASNGNGNSMAGQMKMMNYMMPIYSFVLVFFLPVGLGIYWITGSVIRSVQQVIINHHLNNMDLDAMIKKNQEKAKAKEKKRIEKHGVAGSQISNAAKTNTKNINTAPKSNTMANKAASVKKDTNYQNNGKKYKEGSLSAKANVVKDFNEKNTK